MLVYVHHDDRAPLGYFITFRTYGTWLHGDARGSVNRFRNRYGTEFAEADDDWERQDAKRMARPPVTLNDLQRHVVDFAIRSICTTRRYSLRALNVRTNHVHLVVCAPTNRPELLLNAFKAKATATLRRKGNWPAAHSPWSDGGSKRYLWSETDVERAIEYVLHGQDCGEIDIRSETAIRANGSH